MKPWRNICTKLCWQTMLEDWDDWEYVVKYSGDPVSLSMNLHGLLTQEFSRIRCPFIRHAVLTACRHVCWRELADQLMLMEASRKLRQMKT